MCELYGIYDIWLCFSEINTNVGRSEIEIGEGSYDLAEIIHANASAIDYSNYF